MKPLTCMLLTGTLLFTLTGCDDVLEDLNLDIGVYGSPGYSWAAPEVYYEDTYVEEYWYEETYYEDPYYDDTRYVDDWSFWPW